MIRDQELAGLAMTLGRDAKIKITVGGDNSYCTTDGSHQHCQNAVNSIGKDADDRTGIS